MAKTPSKDIEAKPDDIDCAENARRVLSRMLHKSDIADVEAGNVKQSGKAERRRSHTSAMS